MRLVGALALLLALAGCGQGSQTVMIQLASHGAAPDGVATARFTVEEIRVQVDVPGLGPQWRTVLSDEEGARTFDLVTLQPAVLVAERDLPAGKLLAVELSYDLDETPEPSVLQLAPGTPTAMRFQLQGLDQPAVHLQIDYDLPGSLVVDQGRLELRPSAAVKVMP